MAERASVFEAVNIGLESVPGTEVDASKRLEAISIVANREGAIEPFRPAGSKFNVLVTQGKEHTTASVEGILDYANIVYALAGLIAYGTANIAQVGSLSAYDWTFTPDTDGPDTVATYTIEQGSSVRAQQFEYGQFTGFGFSFNATDSQIAISGEIIGTQLRDGITMTVSPSTVEAVPVHPNDVTVRIATTQAAVGTATPLTRVLGMEWNYTGKFGPVFTVGTENSFVATVEQAAEVGGTLTLEADAAGMAYYDEAQDGDLLWMEIEANGSAIAGTANYSLNITMPIYLTTLPSLSDSDGVVAVQYGYTAAHDATWGKALSVTARNGVSAL